MQRRSVVFKTITILLAAVFILFVLLFAIVKHYRGTNYHAAKENQMVFHDRLVYEIGKKYVEVGKSNRICNGIYFGEIPLSEKELEEIVTELSSNDVLNIRIIHPDEFDSNPIYGEGGLELPLFGMERAISGHKSNGTMYFEMTGLSCSKIISDYRVSEGKIVRILIQYP